MDENDPAPAIMRTSCVAMVVLRIVGWVILDDVPGRDTVRLAYWVSALIWIISTIATWVIYKREI